MTHPLRLGIAGLGTVGAGVIKIVQEHEKMLTDRVGHQIMVPATPPILRSQDRGAEHAGLAWAATPGALARRGLDQRVQLRGLLKHMEHVH